MDANIVFSALIKKGKTLDLIFSERNRLYAAEFLFEEIDKHKEEILKKSQLTESQFQAFLSILTLRINIIPKTEFGHELDKASKITPDPNDTEYVALALHLHCAIWTNDKKLKEQEEVKIFNTTELIEMNE